VVLRRMSRSVWSARSLLPLSHEPRLPTLKNIRESIASDSGSKLHALHALRDIRSTGRGSCSVLPAGLVRRRPDHVLSIPYFISLGLRSRSRISAIILRIVSYGVQDQSSILFQVVPQCSAPH